MARFIDYVLLMTATAIIIYVLVRMVQKRIDDKGVSDPPYNNSVNSSQMKQLYDLEQSSQGVSIKNASFPATQNNALRNFVIKSSFNSAYTGGYMNLDMIKYVLRRGCRYLNFQVFIKDNTPIVAYSQDDMDNSFTSTPPALSLGGVFSTINMNAFNEHSPNPNDPIFIHLQIMSSLPTANSMIAQSIDASFDDNLYKNPTTGNAVPISLNTQMNNLKGKVVILADTSRLSSSPAPASENQGAMKLQNYVNLFVGENNVRLYTDNQLTAQPINPPDPFVYNFSIVYPNLGFFYGINNSNADYLIRNYGAQVIGQAFYYNDNNDIFILNNNHEFALRNFHYYDIVVNIYLNCNYYFSLHEIVRCIYIIYMETCRIFLGFLFVFNRIK